MQIPDVPGAWDGVPPFQANPSYELRPRPSELAKSEDGGTLQSPAPDTTTTVMYVVNTSTDGQSTTHFKIFSALLFKRPM